MTTQDHSILRTLACSIEAVPASVERCSVLWRDLVEGELGIVDAFAQDHRSNLILQKRAERAPALSERARGILERMLLGDSRKVIALELEMSQSALAVVLKQALERLGLLCRPSRVPAAFVILAHAACDETDPVGTFLGDFEHKGRRFTVVTNVLDSPVLHSLTPSERAVVYMVATGGSHVDIAAQRKTSCRTVANQIAAACRRLGVSGRLELLHRIAAIAMG